MTEWQENELSDGYNSKENVNDVGDRCRRSFFDAYSKNEFTSYKFRAYPNALQIERMDEIFGCVCVAYNELLDESIRIHKETGRVPTTVSCMFFEKYVDSGLLERKTLESLQSSLNEAWGKSSVCGTLPKHMRSDYNRQSYTVSNRGHIVYIRDNHINLPQLGLVKINRHREIPDDYTLLKVTIIRDKCRNYYVSVLFMYTTQVIKRTLQRFIGLDYSMQELFVDSDGIRAEYPRYYRQTEEIIQREYRKFSKMVKGSENWKKQKIKIARLYGKISNQRKDFICKWAKELADNYDAVCIEDLSLIDLSKTNRFGKSVYDNAWNSFVTILQEKLEKQGKKLIKIDRFFSSSQKCCRCGKINSQMKDFGKREFVCPYCGAHMDRDMNAAINIREEGKRIAR